MNARIGKFPDLDGFFRGAAWQERRPANKWVVRVLATVDDHVVWRFKGAGVNASHYRDFLDRFERTPAFDRKMR